MLLVFLLTSSSIYNCTLGTISVGLLQSGIIPEGWRANWHACEIVIFLQVEDSQFCGFCCMIQCRENPHFMGFFALKSSSLQETSLFSHSVDRFAIPFLSLTAHDTSLFFLLILCFWFNTTAVLIFFPLRISLRSLLFVLVVLPIIWIGF